MKGWKKLNQVGESAWDRNGERDPLSDCDLRCVRCNLPMVDDSDTTLWVELVGGGFMVRKPGSAKCDTEMGMHPVGPSCAKRFSGYAFTMKNWGDG